MGRAQEEMMLSRDSHTRCNPLYLLARQGCVALDGVEDAAIDPCGGIVGAVDSEATAGGGGEVAAKAGQDIVGQDSAGIPIRPALRESKGAWASVGGELH